jgi:hypothetical protein
MKKHSSAFLLLILPVYLYAQLSDRLWLGGYNEFPGQPGNGQYMLQLIGATPMVEQVPLGFNFESTMAVATSLDGQILFYSNGCEVANRMHGIMPNGSGLNPGGINEQVCPWKGYLVPQGAMALPMPGDSTQFYLIHMGATYESGRKLRLGPLYYSIVDMTQQNGLGDVISKNNMLINDDLGNFNVIRHGNGRDWWILVPGFHNLQWNIFLLTPAGIQTLPPQLVTIEGDRCEHHGQTATSRDGSKLANWGDCKVTVFNFDRCTGMFGTTLEITTPAHWFAGGCVAFSPTGRYIYATDQNVLLRADLESTSPKLDTMRFSYGIGNYTVPGNTFHYLVNGSDNKIYGNFPSRARSFHVLKNPDGATINDINFVAQAVALPVTNVRTLPHFPNFRLFDMQGSICDSLGINGSSVQLREIVPQSVVSLLPNPVTQLLHIHLLSDDLFSGENKDAHIWIMDATGKTLVGKPLDFQGQWISVDVHDFPPGLYFVVLKFGEKNWSGKFVKE